MIAPTRSAVLGSLAVALSLFLPVEEAAARPKKRANASESSARQTKKATRSRCSDTTYWTTNQPLTLAMVQGSKLSAYEGPCADNRERAKGLRWASIDERGKVVGEVERVETRGAESFRGVHGQRGEGIFVRAPEGGMPKVTRTWSLSQSDHDKLVATIALRLRDSKQRPTIHPFLSAHSTSTKTKHKSGEPSTSWSTSTEMAVATLPHTLIILRHQSSGGWVIEQEIIFASPTESVNFPIFRVRSVVDMNGDGVPEIIYHFNEDAEGHGFETVLSSTGHGVWKAQASNEDSSSGKLSLAAELVSHP